MPLIKAIWEVIRYIITIRVISAFMNLSPRDELYFTVFMTSNMVAAYHRYL
jgi:hypothetical protein